MLTRLLVALIWSLRVVTALGSMFGSSISNMPEFGADAPAIKHLMLTRLSNSSPSLDAAKRIIDDLASGPACAHGPTVRLIRQCKLTSPKHQDSSVNDQLDNARYVYALSMSACEMQKAREVLPSKCQMFTNLLDAPMGERDISIVPNSNIDSCLESIKNKHYYWTTYDNFRQQSSSLCESSRIDHDREDLLAHYKQSLAVHSELLDALRTQKADLEDTMASFQASATTLRQNHEELAMDAKRHGAAQEQQANVIADKLTDIFQELVGLQYRFRAAMASGAQQANEGLELLHTKVGSFEDIIRGLMASAGEAATEVTHDMQLKLNHILDESNLLHTKLAELTTGNHLTDIKSHLDFSREAMAESSAIHTAQLTAQKAQIKLSEKALRTVQQTGQKIEELSRIAETIPDSLIDTVSNIQARLAVVKVELQWFGFWSALSALFWLLGSSRLAGVSFVLYTLSRSSAHIFSNLTPTLLYHTCLAHSGVGRDNLQALVFLLITVIVSGITISWFLSMFRTRRQLRMMRVRTRALTELGNRRNVALSVRRRSLTPDRSIRAASLPPEFLPGHASMSP